MKFEFSAGGIVFKKDRDSFKYALILNSYGKWTFPKGRIEKKEKPEEAALREVKEEIGVKYLKIIKKIDKIDYWFREDRDLIHKFVYFFLMEAPETAIFEHQQDEIQDARWFDYQEAKDSLGYKKDDLPLLKKARDILIAGPKMI